MVARNCTRLDAVVAGLAVLATDKVNESGRVPGMVVENWLAR